jgi:hypothetical protein
VLKNIIPLGMTASCSWVGLSDSNPLAGLSAHAEIEKGRSNLTAVMDDSPSPTRDVEVIG